MPTLQIKDEDDFLIIVIYGIRMVRNRRIIIFIFFIILAPKVFSLDSPPAAIVSFKHSIMGNITTPNDVVLKFGDEYVYEEIDIYGKIPNVHVNDKMLVFNYDGFKIMFFNSVKNDKLYLYYWEISNNKYILDLELNIGLKHEDFQNKYSTSHNKMRTIESYSFQDGDMYLKFYDNILEKIYWRPSD
ncbi:MAG: hypothetical protein PQJ46_00665 [Spirochaetales bacterium]|nr:hypothetical protein [Spirochaetales bacterium]